MGLQAHRQGCSGTATQHGGNGLSLSRELAAVMVVVVTLVDLTIPAMTQDTVTPAMTQDTVIRAMPQGAVMALTIAQAIMAPGWAAILTMTHASMAQRMTATMAPGLATSLVEMMTMTSTPANMPSMTTSTPSMPPRRRPQTMTS